MVLTLLQSLFDKTHPEAIFLITTEGQLIESVGKTTHIDIQSLCVLASSNVATSASLGNIMNSADVQFISLYGTKNLFLSILNPHFIVVIVGNNHTYAGKMQFEIGVVKKQVIAELEKTHHQGLSLMTQELMFEDIKDADIDRLFGD